MLSMVILPVIIKRAWVIIVNWREVVASIRGGKQIKSVVISVMSSRVGLYVFS
jgi:hypothetical protein